MSKSQVLVYLPSVLISIFLTACVSGTYLNTYRQKSHECTMRQIERKEVINNKYCEQEADRLARRAEQANGDYGLADIILGLGNAAGIDANSGSSSLSKSGNIDYIKINEYPDRVFYKKLDCVTEERTSSGKYWDFKNHCPFTVEYWNINGTTPDPDSGYAGSLSISPNSFASNPVTGRRVGMACLHFDGYRKIDSDTYKGFLCEKSAPSTGRPGKTSR